MIILFCMKGLPVIFLVSVFENLPEYVLKDRCARFIKHSGKTLNAMLTCCISNPCKMMEFRDTYLRLAEIQEKKCGFLRGNIYRRAGQEKQL